jgi:hypothetical protein
MLRSACFSVPEETMRKLFILLIFSMLLLVPAARTQEPKAPAPAMPAIPVQPPPNGMHPNDPVIMPPGPHMMGSVVPGACAENPVYVPLGPHSYGAVFENVFDVVSQYFEIAYANRYDGRIETFPRIAPGLGQPWKPGSPDLYQRLLNTFQSMRNRAFVLIQVADDGGYFIQVVVFRELEDLPKPVSQYAGNAAFRSDDTVERQFEVIDPAVYDSHWIPLGRDTAFENAIIQKIKKCM